MKRLIVIYPHLMSFCHSHKNPLRCESKNVVKVKNLKNAYFSRKTKKSTDQCAPFTITARPMKSFHWSLSSASNSRITQRYRYKTDVASMRIFSGETDRFSGITVDTSNQNIKAEDFQSQLDNSLKTWLTEGKRCAWFKVDIKNSTFVPVLAQQGFNFHHARDDYVMMFKWLPMDSKPNLPPTCHTNVGVGAMVFNGKEQLLAVSEQHYDYPHWKLPGGYVERGEDLIDGAIREVKEETGVDCCFQTLVTIRHTHNMMFGNSDFYILLMMKALSEQITISHREVKACQWMNVEEYVNHPHVHKFNRLVIKQALGYKDKKIRLDLQKKTVKWSSYVRDMDFLVVEEHDYK